MRRFSGQHPVPHWFRGPRLLASAQRAVDCKYPTSNGDATAGFAAAGWLGLCCSRINDSSHFGHAIGRKAALLRMLTHQVFTWRDVNTVDLVVGDVALDPLKLRPELLLDAARFL